MSADLTAQITRAHEAHTIGRLYGVGDGRTDCVTTVLAVLTEVYGPRVEAERPALMIWDAERPWSPIDACVRLGIGAEVVEGRPHPGRWHVCQGWERLPREGDPGKGHAWLWYEPSRPGPGICLEANVTRPWARTLTWGERVGRYVAGVRAVALTG